MNKLLTLAVVLSSFCLGPVSLADERHGTVQAAYRMPEAATIHLTTPVTRSWALGVMLENKAGGFGVAEEYADIGWQMLGAQVDFYFGEKAAAFSDSWLLSNWIAYGRGGSEEGAQKFAHAASTMSYQWIWQTGFSVQAGLGVQGRVWESPEVPGKFGNVMPNATLALGWGF